MVLQHICDVKKRMTLDFPITVIQEANIILMRNLLLIEDIQNLLFAKNKPFRTNPALVIQDLLE